MPTNQNSRRSDHGNIDPAVAAGLLATSNATCNLFIGGRPKPWMTGPSSSSTSSNVPHPPLVHSDLPSASASGPLSGVSKSTACPRDASSASISPRLANRRRSKDVSRKRIESNLNILPSPAPSDDLPSEAAVVVMNNGDEECETHEPVITQPRKDTIETVSPELARPRKRSREDPPGLENGIGNHPVQPPSASRPSVSGIVHQPPYCNQLQGETRPPLGTHPSLQHRRSSIPQGLLSRQPSRPDGHQSRRPSSLSQQQNCGTVVTAPAVRPAYPFRQCSELLDNYINHTGRMPPGSTSTGRLQLLSDAVACGDHFYLALHQFMCLATVDWGRLPQAVMSLPTWVGTLRVLDKLLAPNSEIDPGALQWFASFPASVEWVVQHLPTWHLEHISTLRTFTALMLPRWDAYTRQCVKRGYPPLVRELVEHLGVVSVVLQHVIFTCIMRTCFGAKETQFSQSADRIFRENQRVHYSGTIREDEYYIHQYEQLNRRYAQYQDATSRSRVNPSSHRTGPVDSSNVPHERNVVLPSQPHHTRQLQQGQAAHISAPLQPHQDRRVSWPPGFQQPPHVQQSFPQQQVSQASRRAASMPGAPPAPIPTNQPLPQPRLSDLFYPAVSVCRPQPAEPNPALTALHQAHLRSPELRPVSLSTQSDPRKRSYRYVVCWALKPKPLERSTPLQTWSFEVPTEMFARIRRDQVPNNGAPPVRVVEEGSVTFRLRGAKLENRSGVLDDGTWAVADTVWPEYIYLHVNDAYCEPRRKLHYGRDLPIDVTPYIREGENKLQVFANLASSDTKTPIDYAFAVETVQAIYEETIERDCPVIPADDVLASIMTRLTSAGTDDDLAIVNANLTIDLFDPFLGGKMFEVPARGRGCRHPSCFDFKTFLQTRERRQPGWASEVDVWKCPICKGDVRPQSLVIDGFLVQVRNKLLKQGLLDTRAIVVEQDGSWKPKPEKSGNSRNGTASRTDSPVAKAGSSSTPARYPATVAAVTEIIDLGDEDS